MNTRFLEVLNHEDGGSILINHVAHIYQSNELSMSTLRFQVPRDFIFPADPWILPVGFDIHVHFRVPGLEYKEDFYTGSLAALYGGVLGVGDMPNTKPPVLSLDQLHKKQARANENGLITILHGIAITDANIDALPTITEEPAFMKVFMAESFGDLSITPKNLEDLFQYLHSTSSNTPLIVHAEDPMLIQPTVDPAKHEQMRPEEAEFSAIKTLLRLKKKYTNVHLHVTHLSSAKSITLLQQHKTITRDPTLTIDITPAHFEFSLEQAIHSNYFKMNPPIRKETTRQALFSALQDNMVDMVSSDHAPHTIAEKQRALPPSGAPGVQETFLVLLHHVLTGALPLKTMITVFHENPKILFPQFHAYDNYFLLIDPTAKFTLTKNHLKTKVKWSLWEGKMFQGKLLGIAKKERGYFQVYPFLCYE